MATPSQTLSALTLAQQLKDAAARATGAAQAAQDAAQRLQATGTAFQVAGLAPSATTPPQTAAKP